MDGEAKLPVSNGNAARQLRVTTLINGVPTSVLMPVIAVADANGRVLSVAENDNQAILRELRLISTLLAQSLGIPQFNLPPLPDIAPLTIG